LNACFVAEGNDGSGIKVAQDCDGCACGVLDKVKAGKWWSAL
jgi:hypothetical protein